MGQLDPLVSGDKAARSFRTKFNGLKAKLPCSFSLRKFDLQPARDEKLLNNNNLKRTTSRRVQFAENPTIHTYEANQAHSRDIWWDHEELDELRKETIAANNASIKEYLISYKRAFREVQCNHKISSQNMAALVAGLDSGHRGLEIFTSLQQVERRNENLSATSSVVALHRRHSKTTSDTSKLVRVHSTSLTSRSRHWARAMGKADMYAANHVQKFQEICL